MRAVHLPVADVELKAQRIEISRHEEWVERDDVVFDPHLSAPHCYLANEPELRIELTGGLVGEDGRQARQFAQHGLVERPNFSAIF